VYENVYEYDSVVVGGTYEALSRAYHDGIPIVIPSLQEYCSLSKDKVMKEQILNYIIVNLGFRSLVLFPGKVSGVSFNEEANLEIATKKNNLFLLKANTFLVYSDINVDGLQKYFVPSKPIEYDVYDFFSLTVRPNNSFLDNDDSVSFPEERFVNQIVIRKQENLQLKVYCYSEINENEMNEHEYSTISSRFVVLEALNAKVLKKYQQNDCVGQRPFLRLKVEERECIQKTFRHYKDTDKIKFFNF